VGNARTVTPAAQLAVAGGDGLALTRATQTDGRLGAELAIAEAYRLFVGGTAPQPPAIARGQGYVTCYVKSAPR
jgi:hypothetical protein